MKSERRWLKSAIEEAKKVETKMPWTRGETRGMFVSYRSAAARKEALVKASA